MNVLIVDDNPDIAKLYSKALEEEGFKTDTYNHPKKALSNFKPHYYDIALLDVRMPDLNGFDLYKEMKKLDSSMKVCFITAFELNYKAFQEIFPDLTQEYFISKPTTLGELKKRINLILQESHSQSV